MIENETVFQKSPSSPTWSLKDTIDIPNRAMNFGDGLFETMVWDLAEIRFFDKHLNRLKGGMQLLNLQEEDIHPDGILHFLASNFPNQRMRVRWNVYRSGQGKYTPETNEVIQTLQLSEFNPASQIKKKAAFTQKIQLFPTSWSAYKTLNALPYILANQERKARGLDEILLLDSRGFISEASASNIFWVKAGIVYTPALSCSCINGISRQVILAHLDEKKIPYFLGEFAPSELAHADQVFVSNCTGISYLQCINQKEYSTVPLIFLNDIFE
ncbi:branched-chain amino acid aminotransferase [Algoriphagus locisalis]|uniref:branched-chain-amino-acid transaminase n=2 Tax=Algoriphagus locisalis TaxID=305507 RepID=A0A1I6YSJ2_9BACT|nr:branched-chain amino acid aminotransferase [Algoriphagus locisalis]